MASSPVNVGGVTLDTSVLDKITKELEPRAARIVLQYGNAIASNAVMRAPVDTGNLINTITANSKMVGKLTFRVQDGTEYGARLELGFVGEDSLGRNYHQPARPFMNPAVEMWRAKFLAAFSELFK